MKTTTHAFMKYFLLLTIYILNATAVFSQTQGGTWTWMSGDAGAGVPVYGTQGVPSASNKPPGLLNAASWTDLTGKFWIYGGFEESPFSQVQADLWMFDPSTQAWTWVKGPGSTPTPVAPVYGTQGVSSPTNTPGSRRYAYSWTDNSGNLWLYGGVEYNNAGSHNDLWKYNITTNEWTWMKGSNSLNDPGTYGTIGVSNAANNPSCRAHGNATWTDNSGNLWLFGGAANNTSNTNVLNDLWKYDVTTNNWTWMSGSNTPGDIGSWGTMGVPDANNRPGFRSTSFRWKDNAGNLWLFGGLGIAGDSGPFTYLSDLWKYDISTNMWTWVNGPLAGYLEGSMATSCSENNTNRPSARYDHSGGACMVDECGNFWLYGGGVTAGWSDDRAIWRYNPSTNEWAWVGNLSATPNYGTLGVSNTSNNPPERQNSNGWFDLNGNLWTGFGYDVINWDFRNDLWKFTPDYCSCLVCNIINIDVTASDTTICGGSTILSATGADNYTWSPATGLSSTTGASVTASPTVTTTYTVIGTIGNCLADTTTITIIVNSGQSADMSYGGPFCQNSANPIPTFTPGSSAGTFSATPSGLTFVSTSTGEIDLSTSTPGTYTVSNSIPASGNCPASISTASITINPFQDASFNYSNGSYCQTAGSVLPTITGNSGGSFSATPFGLIINSSTGEIDLSSPANTYTITYTTLGPCASSSSEVVEISNDLSIVVNDVAICEGEAVLLTGVPSVSGGTFSWSPDGENSPSISVSPTTTSTYTVSYTLGGCMAVDVATVTVNSAAASITTPNTTIDAGEIIQLEGTGGGTYLWSTGQSGQLISVSPIESTSYCLVVTNNGCQDSTCISIEIGCSSVIFAPNCITANGDQTNDEFIVQGDCLSEYHLMIFNRWGEMIFETFDIADSWDGSYKGKLVSDGVYTYLIDAKGFDRKYYNLNGFVTVIK